MASNDSRSEWIRFNYIRCNGQYRKFGIPTPFTYERLVRGLADNWGDIVRHVQKYTLPQPYAVSRIHPRVIPDSQAIFQMNYSNWMTDPNPEPTILIGKKLSREMRHLHLFSEYIHAFFALGDYGKG